MNLAFAGCSRGYLSQAGGDVPSIVVKPRAGKSYSAAEYPRDSSMISSVVN